MWEPSGRGGGGFGGSWAQPPRERFEIPGGGPPAPRGRAGGSPGGIKAAEERRSRCSRLGAAARGLSGHGRHQDAGAGGAAGGAELRGPGGAGGGSRGCPQLQRHQGTPPGRGGRGQRRPRTPFRRQQQGPAGRHPAAFPVCRGRGLRPRGVLRGGGPRRGGPAVPRLPAAPQALPARCHVLPRHDLQQRSLHAPGAAARSGRAGGDGHRGAAPTDARARLATHCQRRGGRLLPALVGLRGRAVLRPPLLVQDLQAGAAGGAGVHPAPAERRPRPGDLPALPVCRGAGVPPAARARPRRRVPPAHVPAALSDTRTGRTGRTRLTPAPPERRLFLKGTSPKRLLAVRYCVVNTRAGT